MRASESVKRGIKQLSVGEILRAREQTQQLDPGSGSGIDTLSTFTFEGIVRRVWRSALDKMYRRCDVCWELDNGSFDSSENANDVFWRYFKPFESRILERVKSNPSADLNAIAEEIASGFSCSNLKRRSGYCGGTEF